MTLKDFNQKRTNAAMKRKMGEHGDKSDWEAENDSSLNAGEQWDEASEKLNFGTTPEYNKKEEERYQREGTRANAEQATGQSFQSDLAGEKEVVALPHIIKRRGLEIRIDAPILTDSEAVKNAISIGLARVSESIVKDVVHNRAEFGDSGPEGFSKTGRNAGTYGSPEAYYGNNKVPYWRGGLRGSFAYMGAVDRMEHELAFTASYAQGVAEGKLSGVIDGAWVEDKIDMNWQKTHNGWSGELDLHRSNAHPFIGGVAEKIRDNLEGFSYLDIFAIYFVDFLKG